MRQDIKQSIFITGASSGLGAALALEYAKPGVVIGLAARREDRLKEVGKDCESMGALVKIYKLDVTNDEQVQLVANDFVKQVGRIDIVIANAGVGGWNHPLKAGVKTMTSMIDVNLSGVVNTLGAFLPQMERQKSGQVVAVSSIASFKFLPGGVYAATKAAVRYLMNGWRLDLEKSGIGVTTIYPGFIDSEMINAQKNKYPFLITSKQAAKLAKKAIDQRKVNYVFPWQWNLILPILKLMPGKLLNRV